MEQVRNERLDLLLGDMVEDDNAVRVKIDRDVTRKSVLDIQEKAEDIASRFTDKFVSLGDIRIELSSDGVPYVSGLTEDQVWFSPWAFSQISEKIGMGAASYMKKCLREGQNELVPLNMNRWISANRDKEVFVRLYDDNVLKSVLSNKYVTFDHNDLLDKMFEVVGTEQYLLESYVVTPDLMNVRLVDPEKLVTQREGTSGTDTSSVGMILKNGMTGMSSISVEFMIYTFACTNGLIISSDRGKMFSRKHFGIGRQDFENKIGQVLEMFPDYIASAKTGIEQARNTRIDLEQRLELYDLMKKELSCGDKMVESIKLVMDQSWDRTAWGIAGAITEVAQTLKSERQYEFERFAGVLMQRLAA